MLNDDINYDIYTNNPESPWDFVSPPTYALDLDDRQKMIKQNSPALRRLSPYSVDHKAQRGKPIVTCGFYSSLRDFLKKSLLFEPNYQDAVFNNVLSSLNDHLHISSLLSMFGCLKTGCGLFYHFK